VGGVSTGHGWGLGRGSGGTVEHGGDMSGCTACAAYVAWLGMQHPLGTYPEGDVYVGGSLTVSLTVEAVAALKAPVLSHDKAAHKSTCRSPGSRAMSIFMCRPPDLDPHEY
jgi:hypothetical protein